MKSGTDFRETVKPLKSMAILNDQAWNFRFGLRDVQGPTVSLQPLTLDTPKAKKMKAVWWPLGHCRHSNARIMFLATSP